MASDLWEVRTPPGGMALELHVGVALALVLRQGDTAIRIGLRDVREVAGGLADAAALRCDDTLL